MSEITSTSTSTSTFTPDRGLADADGPPFPTRTLHTYSACTPEAGIENYCERWAVPMTTQWEVPDRDLCPSLIPGSRRPEWYVSCAPEHWEAVWMNEGYYSPGVCPMGYSVGCTGTYSIFNLETVHPSETVGMCVPYGYSCFASDEDDEDDGQYCYYATKTGMLGSKTMTAKLPAIQIRWREGDLPYLELHPMSTPDMSTTSSGTSNPPESTSSDPWFAPTDTTSSGGGGNTIAPGAIAGIVVGTFAVLTVLVVGLWMCLVRRRRKRGGEPLAQSEPSMVQFVGDMQSQGTQPPYGMAATSYYYRPVPGVESNFMGVGMAPASTYAQDVQGNSAAMPLRNARSSPPFQAQGRFSGPAAAAAAVNLPLNNDLDVGATEESEEGERQRLLQRQSELQERRAQLELEQIEREERMIALRPSQVPRHGD